MIPRDRRQRGLSIFAIVTDDQAYNVFDPDVRHEVYKFDFTVKTNGGKRTYEGLAEDVFLGTLKQVKSSPDGSPTVVTVTKVTYRNHGKVEKTMGMGQYDYATITLR